MQLSSGLSISPDVPRFYFDLHDGGRLTCDDAWVELANVHLARAEAARTLAEVTRDVLGDEARRVITVEVRDEAHQPLFRAALLFGIEEVG